MKTEDMVKALAELEGWVQTLEPQHHIHRNSKWMGRKSGGDWMILPDYLTSYDAIIPLIQKHEFQFLIENLVKDLWNISCSLSATPAQLCEALLKAAGRWQE